MSPAQHIAFDGRHEFHGSILQAIRLCRRSILLLDPTLQDWSLENAETAATLRSAVAAGATLRVLIAKTDWAERHAPRLARLRREHAARVEFRRLPAILRINDSFMVVDAMHTVRLAHPEATRGVCTLDDPGQANAPADRFETAWQESEPCLPATTLGL
jgi:hypothetical protein